MIDPLARARAALLVVDIQERLANAMPETAVNRLVHNTRLLIEAARRFGMPVVVTQQYPKGLGPTLPAVEDALTSAEVPMLHRFDKLEFSAVSCPGVASLLPKLARDQWIVCGMEAHVCVYQSARSLIARGYEVHVPIDAICSRAQASWDVAGSMLERAGAIVTSTETVVFDLLERAGTDDFKALSKLIK